MIKRIKLKNFRQHKDLTVSLTPNMNLIRGPNEAGKSSLIEGAGYALFGSALLMDSFEDVVSWGEKKTSLKTEVHFLDYVATRSSSGAELKKSSGEIIATGHKEVTAHCEKLLGVPPGKALQTFLAMQNDIRGVLSLGPAKTAEFIEALADYSPISDVIAQLNAKLLTGSTKAQEAQISALEEKLSSAEVIDPASAKAIEVKIAEVKASIEAKQTEIKTIDKEIASIVEFNSDLRNKRQGLNQKISTIVSAVAKYERETSAARAAIAAAEGADKELEVLESQAQDFHYYTVWKSMPKLPEELWEGDLASLNQGVADTTAKVQGLRESMAIARAKVKELRAQKTSVTTCPITKEVCAVLSDPAKVEEINLRVEKEIAGLEADMAGWHKAEVEHQSDLVLLDTLLSQQESVERWLDARPGLAKALPGTIPQALAWVGEEPKQVADPDVGRINKLSELLGEAQKAKAIIAAIEEPDSSELGTLKREMGDLPDERSENTQKSLRDKVDLDLTGLGKNLSDRQAELKDIVDRQRQLDWQRQEWNNQIASIRGQMEEIQANNALLKEVKEARLKVTGILWHKVLSGVSAYFSKLRGQTSIVSRSENGFLINGSPSRLSGSTIDIMGLAMRMTVCKVFTNCGILVVDESAAGCDEERTLAMTNVLASSGFDQVIMVSHKDVDEGAADNLVTV